MKKILVLFILFFSYIGSSSAIEQEILLWCNTSACESIYNFDITPDKFNITSFFIYARGDLSSCESEYVILNIWNTEYTICTWRDSSQFDLLYSEEILDFNGLNSIDFTSLSTAAVNYWPGMTNYYEVKILIDYEIIEETWSTWSWIIINNINNDPWINKPIFNIETLKEIFEYEALIMLFILFYTFFQRIIWKKRKPKNFIF